MNTSLKKKELIGVIFIFLFGTLIHFVYDWSGQSSFVALFAPVNESVWEHLKLILWPTFMYSIYEYITMKKNTHNFWTAKLLSLCTSMIFIVVIFYSYTTVIGDNILFIDILIFLIAIILGQFLSYKLITTKKLPAWTDKFSFILILVLIIIFMFFTFYTPHIPIFRNPIDGTYGI